jgi:2-keto-4-pentenoate hydratase/2-oxohepta-3-ene-1,7-dioic acid hydratase in catechol pathway
MADSERNSTNYKLATYETTQGPRAGAVSNEAVFDLAELTGKPSYATMLGVLDDWAKAEPLIEAALAKEGAKKGSSVIGSPLAKVQLLAPVLYPPTIFCAGANYSDHMAEMARVLNLVLEPDLRKPGLAPWHFVKASRTVVRTHARIPVPAYAQKLDWEGELTAVIGRPAKNVPVESALDYVAGYTVANDLSARDFMVRPNIPETSPFRFDWISHKSFDGACPLGPWIVPAKQIPDPQRLGIKLWVNDVLKQDSDTSKMIFSVAEQIAQLSARLTLHPGDLILTGTPAGVGMARKEFLKSGDVVRVWVEHVGTLTTTLT